MKRLVNAPIHCNVERAHTHDVAEEAVTLRGHNGVKRFLGSDYRKPNRKDSNVKHDSKTRFLTPAKCISIWVFVIFQNS